MSEPVFVNTVVEMLREKLSVEKYLFKTTFADFLGLKSISLYQVLKKFVKCKKGKIRFLHTPVYI